YEGDQAPSGIVRLSVDFGLLHEGKYRPDVVRAFELEPHGSTFNRGLVANGWGAPDRVGQAHGITVRDGLFMGGADPRGDGVALGF
ncbi:MAG TPA: hypothetical protein VFL90_07005, partial [Methylomirabilota bacterium]|nr:hypothetical protein [Methylomirabilota bacterium]